MTTNTMTKFIAFAILGLYFSASLIGAEHEQQRRGECVAYNNEGTRTKNALRSHDPAGPIAYGYDPADHTVKYRYPEVNTECIHRDGDAWLHLSCAGSPMLLTRGPIQYPRAYTSTYLYYYHSERSANSNDQQQRSERGLGIHGEDPGLTLFQSDDSLIRCARELEPIFINATKRHGYQTGHYVTPLDFLAVLEFEQAPNGNLVARATLTPAASLANNHEDDEDDDDNKQRHRGQQSTRYGHGLLHLAPARRLLDYRSLYKLENQLEVFKDHRLKEHINETQHLVQTQLISDEDFYYANERAATYFYENTVPVWKSVADGNWARVGRIMREVAAQTDSEFDLYATSYGHFKANQQQEDHSDEQRPLVLAPTTGDDDNELAGFITAPVPLVLHRYMMDKKNPRRGISYHVINNPFASRDTIMGWIRRRNKCRMVECHMAQPEFLDPQQGFTFCCRIDEDPTVKKFAN